MKIAVILGLLLSAVSAFAARPDLPPDSTGQMYLSFSRMSAVDSATANDGLDIIVQAGERNLQWLVYINSFRPGNPLSLTSKETQSAYPIDKPMMYNPKLVLGRFNDLKAGYPAALAAVVFNGGDFTKEPPVAVEVYVESSRNLDKIYQSAIRWRMMQPYLDELAEERPRDIRGFYTLSRLADRVNKLNHFSAQSADDQKMIRDALVSMCLNLGLSASCENEIDADIAKKTDLEPVYQNYLPVSQGIWNSFFTIPEGVARTDFKWAGDVHGTGVFQTPFFDPKDPKIQHFLQDNIQDEWKFGNWHLELPFQNGNQDEMTHVVFQAGSTPHVNELGGKIITMDANQPLTEYDAQWTIRHEYGHVLGLPDCYIEFYVKEAGYIVSYQLDIDNLMCSRRGHVKETNVLELQRVYSKMGWLAQTQR